MEKIYNILLLGETGVGKSTFINAFANYLNFATIDDTRKNDLICLIPNCFTASEDDFEQKKSNSIMMTMRFIMMMMMDNELLKDARLMFSNSEIIHCNDGRQCLPPHQVRDTISVNEARRFMIQLTQPLADTAKNIQDNRKFLNLKQN